MKQKLANTLVALLLLGAMWGAITYYDKRKSKETPKAETTVQEKILPLDSQHIRSLTLSPRGGEAVTCQREGSTWSIVEPKQLRADQSTISSLVSSLTSATVDEVVDAHPSSVKDFGLDPPAFTLDVSTDAKPPKLTLNIGDETPTSGGLYAQVAGNPRVFTLASYMKTSLEKNLFDLRDRRALSLDADRIQKIELNSKDKKWTLTKNPEGVWDLVLPPPVRADRFTVEGLVSELRGLSMQSIVAEEKKNTASYGFGAPELRVQVSGSDGSQTLTLGKKEGKDNNRYYAMNSALPQVFTLSSDFLTQFNKKPEDLREKDLFSFSSFEVKHVEVDTPKGHRVFETQKDNQWKQTAPSTKNVTRDKMDTLLNRLRDLRADTFPKAADLAQFGLNKPAYRFNIQFGDKNQTEIVEISKVGDHIYARRSTDEAPCELAKTALDDVEKALNDLG
jgi:uncharacterized protein DUF4340